MGSAQHPRQLLRTCRRGRFTLKPTTLSTCLDTSKLQLPSQCECGWYSHCKAQLNKNMFSSKHLGILLSPSEIAPRCSLAPSDCARGIAVVWAELSPTTGHKAARKTIGLNCKFPRRLLARLKESGVRLRVTSLSGRYDRGNNHTWPLNGRDMLHACANPSASSRTCGGATALQAS